MIESPCLEPSHKVPQPLPRIAQPLSNEPHSRVLAPLHMTDAACLPQPALIHPLPEWIWTQ